MADNPTAPQLLLLRFIGNAGGYVDQVEDASAAEACVDAGWLTPEGRTGYALTIDGMALLRRRPI